MREALEEANSAGTLVLDIQPPEVWKHRFLWYKPPACGILVQQL